MTPESVNIAIAELMGWKFQQGQEPCYGGPYKATGWFSPDGVFVQGKNRNPNYHADLNAMAEAEATLQATAHLSVGNEHRAYLLHLMELVNPGKQLWDNGTFLGSWADAIKTAEATAPQRAEAFLRTKGKWRAG